MIYNLVIKRLKVKDEIIGTVKLSIPKILNCSRIVARKAIKIILLLSEKSPNKTTETNIIRLVISIVIVPIKDFF